MTKHLFLGMSLILLIFYSPFQSRGQEKGPEMTGLFEKNTPETLDPLTLDELASFSELSDEDKRRLFESLSPDDKLRAFQKLGEAEKRELFNLIPYDDKALIIQNLSDMELKSLVRTLSPPEKETLLRVLTDLDRVRILNTFDVREREEWLKKIPGLEEAARAEPPEEEPLPLEEEEAPSSIERILSGEFPTDISRELRQFGYDVFKREISTFLPVDAFPVGADYAIGPGDSFTIHLWGKTEKTHPVSVTRDGKIIIPRLGALDVTGLTFGEMKFFLRKKFQEYYNDFEMTITMDSLRTIGIFVVGEARNPGTYSVNALSTVITALFAAGGPTKNGSLRRVQLRRNGTTVKTVDLYDFFIKGDNSDDIRLQPGDTIFIPVLGPVAGLAGYVKRPAIYELLPGETIGTLIEFAGGVLPLGHLKNVVVERIQGHSRRVLKSFNLDPGRKQKQKDLKMRLSDGDVVKIYPVHEGLRKVVYLEGHVKYPREYELFKDMRLKDLIPSYESLLPEPYLPQAEIIRLIPPDYHPEIIEFNLGALLDGKESENFFLRELDRVIVYDRWEKMDLPEVSITGEIRRPGSYRLYKGMTVKDLVFAAGNLTNHAFQDRADLTRAMAGAEGTEIRKIEFSLRNAVAGDPTDNLLLLNNDVIHVRQIPRYEEALTRRITIEGEVMFPGEYGFSSGERLLSVIERAGGLTKEAYPRGAVFLRESVKEIQGERLQEYLRKLERDIATMSALSAETALDKDRAAILQQTMAAKRDMIEQLRNTKPTGRMIIELDKVLKDPQSQYNFELRPSDRLIISKRPDTVNVLGEVFNPTAIFAQEGKTVSFYLNRVGGPTEMAQKKQIYVVRANGFVYSKSQESGFGSAKWDEDTGQWSMRGDFEGIVMDPGDTIIVPQKVERYPWLRIVKDVTQIMYQIAVAAGIFIVAR
jgi:protein involved in polysaccharide export with SLBB domain